MELFPTRIGVTRSGRAPYELTGTQERSIFTTLGEHLQPVNSDLESDIRQYQCSINDWKPNTLVKDLAKESASLHKKATKTKSPTNLKKLICGKVSYTDVFNLLKCRQTSHISKDSRIGAKTMEVGG
jgi:hypothetical protein